MAVMEVGEAFAGDGPDAAHVTTMLGDRDGPVAAAFATALATPSFGHRAFLAVLQPGLPVKPYTLFVNAAPVADADGTHARITWGAAQAGVAAGVADTVAGGIIAQEEADSLMLVATVWVDPAATDEEAVWANNRSATRAAIIVGRSNLPAPRDAAAKRNDAWNHLFRPR